MTYKGNDLDLRTPWRPAHDRTRSDWGYRPQSENVRGAPISVDQTVLACCNAAYEAAVFHGAREVRPEHLLYALTRVETARDILEQHGVNSQQLRRETAAMMSEEPASGGWDSRGSPAAAPGFEDMLRRAAARAGQDGVAASVQDLMRAALGPGRDAAVAAVILKAAADPQALERWAAEASLPAVGVGAVSLQSDAAEKFGARLDQVEAGMETLVAGLAEFRQAMDAKMAEIGASLARLADRFEAVRVFSDEAPDVAGRLAALESRITSQPPAIAEAVSYMLTRRSGDEDGLAVSGSSIAGRLAALESAVRAQAARMEEANKTHEHDLSEIYEALVKLGTNQQTLAGNLEAWRLDSGGDISIVSNRVESMERALRALLPRPRQEPVAVATPSEPRDRDSDEAHASEPPTGSFKRWLFGTTRVLPSSWREDMAALRASLPGRRNGGG